MKVLLVLRFALELCAITAMAVAGFSIGLVAGIVLPLALIVTWGRFVAPKANQRLDDPWRLLMEIGIFLAVGVALAISGQPFSGLVLAATSIVVACLLRAIPAAA